MDAHRTKAGRHAPDEADASAEAYARGATGQKRSERAAGVLAAFRADVPKELLGNRLTREEEDEILGFGPDGV